MYKSINVEAELKKKSGIYTLIKNNKTYKHVS